MEETKQPTKPGKPTLYSEEVVKEICMLIMEGLSLEKISLREDMPAKRTILDWLADPNKEDFMERYIAAKGVQVDLMFDSITDLADQATSKENAPAIKVRVDARMWVASRFKPKKYGNFKAVEISGQVSTPLPDFSHLTFDELYALKYGRQQ